MTADIAPHINILLDGSAHANPHKATILRDLCWSVHQYETTDNKIEVEMECDLCPKLMRRSRAKLFLQSVLAYTNTHCFTIFEMKQGGMA